MNKLHIESHGDGEIPIVICNGLSQSTANWRGIARQHPGFRWILFDARGCGKSEMGPTPYHIDDHVTDLLRAVEESGADRPVVMGFSHGSRVALRAAAEHGERFRGAIFVSLAVRRTARRMAHVASWKNCLDLGGVRAMAWASLPNIVGRKLLEKFKDLNLLVNGTVSRNNEPGLKAMFEGMAAYPPAKDDALRVKLPALIMRGGEDPLVEQGDVDDLMSAMPQAISKVFLDCGHTLPLEETGHFMEAVQEFIHSLK